MNTRISPSTAIKITFTPQGDAQVGLATPEPAQVFDLYRTARADVDKGAVVESPLHITYTDGNMVVLTPPAVVIQGHGNLMMLSNGRLEDDKLAIHGPLQPGLDIQWNHAHLSYVSVPTTPEARGERITVSEDLKFAQGSTSIDSTIQTSFEKNRSTIPGHANVLGVTIGTTGTVAENGGRPIPIYQPVQKYLFDADTGVEIA